MQRREREKSMEVPVCNPNTWKVEMGRCQAHTRMDYTVRPCLKVGRGNNEAEMGQEKGAMAKHKAKTLMGTTKEMGHGPFQEEV